MSDRELLELAAKAAGHDITHPWNAERLSFKPPIIGLCITGVSSNWNPLTDDGQALRLAVKLRLEISFPEETPPVVLVWGNDWSDELLVDDPAPATRRAIVRAAAEIGRAMP